MKCIQSWLVCEHVPSGVQLFLQINLLTVSLWLPQGDHYCFHKVANETQCAAHISCLSASQGRERVLRPSSISWERRGAGHFCCPDRNGATCRQSWVFSCQEQSKAVKRPFLLMALMAFRKLIRLNSTNFLCFFFFYNVFLIEIELPDLLSRLGLCCSPQQRLR